MSLKVKAKEREMKVGLYAGTYRYVMVPEIYSALAQEKVIREAALRSGVSQGVMQACWDAAGSVIKAWATEGHSVALPGLGTMRFGLSAKSVADVNDVKSSLIKTCYDRNGKEVKRVTSADDGIIEDNNDEDSTGEDDGGSTTTGGNSGSGGTTTGGDGGGDDDEGPGDQ